MERQQSNSRFTNRVRFIGSPYAVFQHRADNAHYEEWCKREAQKERDAAKVEPETVDPYYIDVVEGKWADDGGTVI